MKVLPPANRRNQNKNGTGSPSYNFNVQNQITGMTYDAAGNVTSDGTHTYTYDAENRLIKVDNGSVATYSYDAFGHRIATTVNTTAREFLFDASGHMTSMMRSNPRVWDRGELYAGGWHLASYVGGSTYFNHADWLGTVRVRTGPTGAILTNESYASLPFGDCLTQAGGSDCNYAVGGTPSHFTDQDRDTETRLDHFMFRQYSSTQGRWMTPDPAGMAAVAFTNPQTWNRYAYVANNSTNGIDSLGLVIKNELWNPDDDRFYNEWQVCAYEGICGDNWTLEPGLPDLPVVPPRIPKLACYFTANVGNASQATQDAIEQIYNQAGVGIAFVNGSSDLSATYLSIPPFTRNGHTYMVLGDDNSGAAALVNSALPDVARGVITAHEWGHYLLNCIHGMPSLMSQPGVESCGTFGLMADGRSIIAGHSTPFAGNPFPMIDPRKAAYQFTPDQIPTLQKVCRDMHPDQK